MGSAPNMASATAGALVPAMARRSPWDRRQMCHRRQTFVGSSNGPAPAMGRRQPWGPAMWQTWHRRPAWVGASLGPVPPMGRRQPWHRCQPLLTMALVPATGHVPDTPSVPDMVGTSHGPTPDALKKCNRKRTHIGRCRVIHSTPLVLEKKIIQVFCRSHQNSLTANNLFSFFHFSSLSGVCAQVLQGTLCAW